MNDSSKTGFEVGLKAQAMASPQRVQSVIDDEKKFWELVADLASFLKAAEVASKHSKEYLVAVEGLIMAISFVSHMRQEHNKFFKSNEGN